MSNIFEQQYKTLLMDCLLNGEETNNRTAISTYTLFNKNLNIDLTQGFPIVTGKKIFFNKALHEFLWIFNGDTNIEYLNKNNIYWWDEYANKDGELGKIYGYQIKKFNNKFNQIDYCINEIKNNSRRAIITLWNPCDLNEQSLPCCFTNINFVRINNNLNCLITFRSSDLFLGLPYDIIFSTLLLNEISLICNLTPHKIGINIANAHIYKSHYKAVLEYNKSEIYTLPTLKKENNNYSLINYKHGKYIKANLIN